MSIELKPREWLLALWANGTFTVEAEDAPCWQAIAPPEMFRVVAAFAVEATIKELRASLAAAEAKLADEVRHADELATALESVKWVQPTYNGSPSCSYCGRQKHLHKAECGLDKLVAAHATRRAGKEETR